MGIELEPPTILSIEKTIEPSPNSGKNAVPNASPKSKTRDDRRHSPTVRKKRRPQRIFQGQNKRLSSTQPLPDELGKYMARDVALLNELEWEEFAMRRRKDGDFAQLNFDHPVRRLLKNYKNRDVPVKLANKPWSKCRVRCTFLRGPHKSSFEYLNFYKKNSWI